MKKLFLLILSLLIISQTLNAQAVVLDSNGTTIKWTGTIVPSPYFIQANPRGPIEWFAIVNNSTNSNITYYAKNIQTGITYFTPPGGSSPIPFNNIVTTLVTTMTGMFDSASTFNQNIDSWDVGNVTNMVNMFKTATAFNQNIGSWNVSNVTNMTAMFNYASAFNQNIGSWNVSNVSNMRYMFVDATAFNQNIGSWDVSNVISMISMFENASSFNQNIGSWNVSNVTNMNWMFSSATAFNQNIGSWNVSNVNSMSGMFSNATAFNQNIGDWNVSNVTIMSDMFGSANAFNQNIGSWNVSNVTNMGYMFNNAQLSTANYDALLIGWSTIISPETPLKPNVPFDAGFSKYCNGASARNILDFAPNNWTITDGGLDCSSLDIETFDTIGLKLYPNPVLSLLNVKVDYYLIYKTYTIIDGLGRVVLNGKLNEVDTIINVEKLSKGIYYLKISDNNSSKFIKE